MSGPGKPAALPPPHSLLKKEERIVNQLPEGNRFFKADSGGCDKVQVIPAGEKGVGGELPEKPLQPPEVAVKVDQAG